jgi:hypothetical protein
MTLDCTCNRLREAEAKAAKWDAIVRCGECKHKTSEDPDIPFGEICKIHRIEYPHDFFCAWGERRES